MTYITRLIENCVELGFGKYIVADPALAIHLRERQMPISIHISGELGEMNSSAIKACQWWGAQRIIFHRRMAIADMKACIASCPELEYEAFALNELCDFHGGFCSTLHCDALDHMCHIPYRFDTEDIRERVCDPEKLGASGCGLCALYRLRDAGVTHLKIVSRGNYSALTVRDVEMMKKALAILDQAKCEDEYIESMKRQLFDEECSGRCYYLSQIG